MFFFRPDTSFDTFVTKCLLARNAFIENFFLRNVKNYNFITFQFQTFHLFVSDGSVELVVIVARQAVGSRQAVAVDARHGGHDDGGGAGGRGSHRDPDEAVVVVDDATPIDNFVIFELDVASTFVAELSAASDPDKDQREHQDTCWHKFFFTPIPCCCINSPRFGGIFLGKLKNQQGCTSTRGLI